MDRGTINEGSGRRRARPDASDDGHPCEAALEFRRILRIRCVSDEVPADVLDLCVAIAWIGKAVSRTDRVREFLSAGMDPNTWQVIAAAGGRRTLAAYLLDIAESAGPGPGMGAELASIRQSEGFIAAAEAMRRTSAAAARRWSRLEPLCADMIDVERIPDSDRGIVLSLDLYRSGRNGD